MTPYYLNIDDRPRIALRFATAYEKIRLEYQFVISIRCSSPMKHLETQPVKQTFPKARAPKSPTSRLKLFLITGLLIAGAGYAMTAWWSPVPADHVTEKEKAALITGFTHLRTIAVEQITDRDVDAALDTMHLDPSLRQAMKQTLDKKDPASSPTVLAKVTVWDFASQDGDVVRISSAGYAVDVVLQNEPAIITLPIDASQSIQITGVHDGGGGITLGIQNGAGKVLLPVMTEGQAISLPVNL